MARVYNGFSPFRPLAAHQAAAARLGARAARAARRGLARFLPALIDELRNSEDRSRRSEENFSRHLPGSVFDARYKGLTAQAADIDAGICRQERLR